jgi:O-antigen ligase
MEKLEKLKGEQARWAKSFSLFGLMSLFIFAIGIFTSITISAGGHIALFAAALSLGFFGLLKKERWGEVFPLISYAQFTRLPKSAWCLLALVLVGELSLVVNGLDVWRQHFLTLKYFLGGVLGIYVYRAFFSLEKRKSVYVFLVYSFLLATTVASFSGIWGLETGFTPLRNKVACHPTRACGLYGMYMTYGYGISLFLSLLASVIVYRKRLKNIFPMSLSFSLFIGSINLLGLIFSYARGAYLGLIAGLTTIFLLEYRKKAIYLGGICLVAWGLWALAGIKGPTLIPHNFINPTQAPSQFREMVASDGRQNSVDVRVSQYKAAWQAFLENPVLGVGYKNFEFLSREIKRRYRIEFASFQGHAHNNFLELLASTGILGLSCFVLFLFFWARESYLKIKNDDIVGYIVLPVIVSFVVSGLFQYTAGDGENMFFIMGLYSLSSIKS